ncbi:ferredoxin-type protein NapF [Basfia succiniciproducens]|uniref:Ferredoxin-type protein NapF n=1 Tax=Basfia succiniciproducens TaxID=653940 RepID=A0A1G5DB95_9PAST|nr:ferredoxin-type protein NapF [Basfia succiniciproducens]QIM69399.1 ferredoxin-type protein NapF [Basfia succiniciproducens]SCY11690.1 periplasmic nitrate reductase maturation protein NapF [Basfia succiniciproducens]
MMDRELPRRQFLRGGFLKSLQSETVKQQGFLGVRPPWTVAEAQFVADCTRCGDCIAVCETQILVKGVGDFPEVRFSRGECTFCMKCVEVCRQPVFRPTEEAAWQHKVEIQTGCLANNQVECRSCEDNCERRAIRFKREIGSVAKPQIDLELCNGCGACLSVCPVLAIKVLMTSAGE